MMSMLSCAHVSKRAKPTSPSFTRPGSWPYKALVGDGGERNKEWAREQRLLNGRAMGPAGYQALGWDGTLLGATGKPKTCLATRGRGVDAWYRIGAGRRAGRRAGGQAVCYVMRLCACMYNASLLLVLLC